MRLCRRIIVRMRLRVLCANVTIGNPSSLTWREWRVRLMFVSLVVIWTRNHIISTVNHTNIQRTLMRHKYICHQAMDCSILPVHIRIKYLYWSRFVSWVRMLPAYVICVVIQFLQVLRSSNWIIHYSNDLFCLVSQKSQPRKKCNPYNF